jgi:hypothetical protein
MSEDGTESYDFTESAEELRRKEIAQDRRALIAARLTIVGLVVFMVASIVALLYAVSVIRGTQQNNAPKIDNTEETLKLVKDCVLPGGKCFERGQKQTADAVGSISLRQVAAVACGDQPGTQGPLEIAACVERSMKIFEATR